MSEPKIYKDKLSNYQQLPQNPNAGTERGLYMLEESVSKGGAGRSMLAGKDNVLIAGNHAAEVMGEKLGDEVIVVETDGTRPIVHKRIDVAGDSPRGREMAVADNRSSEVGLEWDADVMAAMQEAGEIDLEQFFRENELDDLLDTQDHSENQQEYNEDVHMEYRCPRCGYEWNAPAQHGA